jgi:hypothetical protein
VVLGPQPWFVQDHCARADGGVEEGQHGVPVGGREGDVRLAEPSPELKAPIQKSGCGGTP